MRYRKRPVEIEAVRFNGSSTHANAIHKWINGEGGCPDTERVDTADLTDMEISTLEGAMTAKPGDYIIKGVRGEFYPCKPDIFEQTYEGAGE